MNLVATKSGHFRHYSLDTKKTLCGRDVAHDHGNVWKSENVTRGADCHRCLKKAPPLRKANA